MYKQAVKIRLGEKIETLHLEDERNAEDDSELEFTSDSAEGDNEASSEDSSEESEYVLTLDVEIRCTTRCDPGQNPGGSSQRKEILRGTDVAEKKHPTTNVSDACKESPVVVAHE